MVAFAFDARLHEPQYGGGLAQFPPAKKMKVVIVNSSLETTKKGDGGYMQLIMRCIEGPMQGKEGFDNLNLSNTNQQAVAIANKQLAAYCYVTNTFQLVDSSQLHNKPFLIDVDFQKGHEPSQEKPQGGYTQVSAIYNLDGSKPGMGNGAAPAQTAPVAPPQAMQPQGAAAPQSWQTMGNTAPQPAQIAPVAASPSPWPTQQQPTQTNTAPGWGNR